MHITDVKLDALIPATGMCSWSGAEYLAGLLKEHSKFNCTSHTIFTDQQIN